MKEYTQPVTITVENKLNSLQGLALVRDIILNEFELAIGNFNITAEGQLTRELDGAFEVLRDATDVDKAIFILVGAMNEKASVYEGNEGK